MNVAFIPVRGGSKSIPLKNIKTLCGKPLVYWVTRAACMCDAIDVVYIATDNDEIKRTVEAFEFNNLEVVSRSDETATDNATTESAMLEFAEKHAFDNIVLIQATSPTLKSADLKNGLNYMAEDDVDSVISVVRQKRFNWNIEDDGYVKPLNYDYMRRPRRQEFEGYLVENGAFYISSRKNLLQTKCRISGRIKAVEMDSESYHEIDEPDDWGIVETIMRAKRCSQDIDVSKIKILLTDCDGCLTDAGMYYSEFGDELKKFNTRDGMGFRLLKNHGILTGIITSENVKLNKRRADKLELDYYIAGCNDKIEAVKRICKDSNLSLDNVAYIGDDINDLDVIRIVGLGCAPADALPSVKEAARFVTKAKGGDGVIREVADLILRNLIVEE